MSLILPILQLTVIVLYSWLAWRIKGTARLAYKAGWRDGQMRLISLTNEYVVRPDVPPGGAYFAAVQSALQEDPEAGRKHLPWWNLKDAKKEKGAANE